MAIESLEIDVIVNVVQAMEALEELEDELKEVSRAIDRVDRRGTEGISINTRVESVTDDLARLRTELEAFERATSLDVGTNVDTGDVASRGGGGVPINFDRPDFSLEGRTIQVSGTSRRGRDGGPLSGILGRLRGEFSDLMDSVGQFDLRMSDLHNAMARLVPLLFVLIGAIPAAYTALIGLAAAGAAAAASLAAIAGFGALGVALQDGQIDMARLQEVGSDIRDSFIEAFAPLAEQLQPLFMDAVDGLDRFFQVIADNGDALLELRDEAVGFGEFMIDFVPQALRATAGLVEGMSEVFGNIGDFLTENFAGGMRTLLRITRDAMPAVAEVGLLLARAIPTLVEMSIGFMRVLGAVIRVIGVFSKLLGLLGIGPELFGFLTASVLAATSAMLLFRTAVVQAVLGSLATLGTRILALISTYTSYTANTLIATAATYGLSTALLTLIGIATLGLGIAVLGGVVGGIASQFQGLTGDIKGTTDALREFDNISSSIGGSGSDNPYGFRPEDGEDGTTAATSSGSGDVTINIESSGDPQEDRSNTRYAAWAQGRDTGGS